MPPKLFLNVNASVQSLRPGALGGAAAAGDDDRAAALMAPSIEIGPSGTLKLYKSHQAFEFNPLGRTRAAAPPSAPLGEGVGGLRASYTVRASQQAALL